MTLEIARVEIREISPQRATVWVRLTANYRETLLVIASMKQHFQNEYGYYGNEPTWVISKAPIDIVGDCRNGLEMVFDVLLHHAADAWHIVEIANKARATLKKMEEWR